MSWALCPQGDMSVMESPQALRLHSDILEPPEALPL